MAGVDDRVVQMQFDNAEFERKLSATLGSLDKLQKSLDFSNSRKGLDDLNAAGGRFNLEGIGTHIEGVSTKFLAMATIGITALTQIATRAISAGAQFVSSFTFGPLMDGFHEMETAVGSTQTILANTARYGTQLPEVNANLSALNTYADKTIYNFGQMTHNLGLFTNAGIKVGDATSMIKGFSNAAAASGTDAQGAASAAYQLSQALSAGQIRLMDWRSLTNVGMGNKNMQDSLVEIADKMGTVSKAGLKGSDIQKDFNGSLEKGWLSADVMSTYLKIMAGDMDDAKLKSMGFTAAQIKGFQDQQKMAEDAATKVRTATQLVGTVKEAIGSGWADTFRIVLGNFDEATTLFTDINNAIGNLVSGASDARNHLLQGWKDLGGRTELISAFKESIKDVSMVVKEIKGAFRDVFPPTTAQDLYNLTEGFHHLAWVVGNALRPHLGEIRDIFRGLFSILDIGWTVIKQVGGLLLWLIGHLSGSGAGFLSSAASIGVWLQQLDNLLVSENGIAKFFDHIYNFLEKPLAVLKDITDGFKAFIYTLRTGFTEDEGTPIEHLALVVRNFFGIFSSGADAVDVAVDRVHTRFDGLRAIFERLSILGSGMMKILDSVFQVVSDWFKELGSKISASLKPGDFDAAVDAVNVGLLGGIILMFKKFMKIEDNFDLSGGFFTKANEALDSFKDKMKAVQTELKAKALMEIAIAVGVLTASVLILSMIDSAALTSAMTALAIGFAQLVASMKMLDNIASNTAGAAKLTILAAAMTLMAGAAVTLSIAVRILAGLSWEELARGMAGVTAMMAVMVGAIKALEGDTAGVLAASVAMVAVATAMTIMAGAVALFGQMNWETMAKGLIGIAVALGIIVVAMMAMPVASLLAAGLAMIPLATGLTIMAGAVALFGNMDIGTMVQGLIGVAAALVIIAAAMTLMPLTLPITAAGLILVGIALGIMAGAIALMGNLDLGVMVQGLAGVAALLLILAVGVNAMSGAIVGAAALVIVAGALTILTKVLKTLGDMSIGDLIKALIAMAAAFVILGLAGLVLNPVIPSLLALGVAMTLVGAGFALFGAGAWMIGKALQVLAETGVVAVKVLIEALNMILAAIPNFIAVLLGSLLKSSGDILNAAQVMLGILTVLLLQILDTVIKLAPKIAEALVAILTAALGLIRAKFPDVVETFFDLLMTMLRAIRDHMGEVVSVAIDIMINFANTLANNAFRLVNAAINLVMSIIAAIGSRANDITGAGTWLLLTFLAGMINNLYRIIDFAVSVVITLVQTIANETGRLVRAAADLLINFAQSLANNIWRVAHNGVDIVIAFLNAIGGEAVRLANGGADALIHFLNGLADAIRTKGREIREAGMNVASAIIDGITGGIDLGGGRVWDSIKGIAGGAVDSFLHAIHAKSPSRDFMKAAGYIPQGIALGISNDDSPQESVVQKAEEIIRAFSETINKMPDSLEGLDVSPVITPVLDLSKVKAAAGGIDGLFPGPSISPDVSLGQARTIATTAEIANPEPPPTPFDGPREIKFEQNIYSPEALSTNDIFKGTRSQLALAKEELDIP